MKKTRTEKGITLVALIITIIILLILAVVTINSIKNGQIIEYAQNAKTDYNAEKEREEEWIENYLAIIDANNPNKGTGTTPTPDPEAISVETDCIKYYADVDGNKEPDGIIYIDIANTQSGSWSGHGYTIENKTTGLKEYYISKESYTTKLGTAPVLSLVPGSTGEERFYVMGLEDIKKTINGTEYDTFYWYESAYSSGIAEYLTLTKTDVGEGKTNTANMIDAWGVYGDKNDRDIWGVIEEGWYIPSIEEWAAFASAFKITWDSESDSYYNFLGLERLLLVFFAKPSQPCGERYLCRFSYVRSRNRTVLICSPRHYFLIL